MSYLNDRFIDWPWRIVWPQEIRIQPYYHHHPHLEPCLSRSFNFQLMFIHMQSRLRPLTRRKKEEEGKKKKKRRLVAMKLRCPSELVKTGVGWGAEEVAICCVRIYQTNHPHIRNTNHTQVVGVFRGWAFRSLVRPGPLWNGLRPRLINGQLRGRKSEARPDLNIFYI